MTKRTTTRRQPSPVVLVGAGDTSALSNLLRRRYPVALCDRIEAARFLELPTTPLAFVCDLDSFEEPRLQILASLRRLHERGLPVLAISEDEREASFHEVYAAGVREVIVAPPRPGELLAKLARIIDEHRHRSPRAIPRRIGDYILQQAIGRGGTSTVFRAWHKDRPHDDLAMKFIWPHLASDPEVIQRFRREINLLQSLNHPGLVRFIASGRHDDWFYYVMEHLEGGTLRGHIRDRGPGTPAQAIQLLIDLAGPLAYVHDQGLVHRDIKPENVHLLRDRVVLGDFGLAKLPADRGITLEDDILGTPLYLAPEALRCEELDLRADIYAATMCAYEWLHGDPVLDAPDALALLNRISREGIPDPAELLPDLPASLTALLRAGLAAEPKDRLADARALRDLAQACLRDLERAPERDAPPVERPPASGDA